MLASAYSTSVSSCRNGLRRRCACRSARVPGRDLPAGQSSCALVVRCKEEAALRMVSSDSLQLRNVAGDLETLSFDFSGCEGKLGPSWTLIPLGGLGANKLTQTSRIHSRTKTAGVTTKSRSCLPLRANVPSPGDRHFSTPRSSWSQARLRAAKSLPRRRSTFPRGMWKIQYERERRRTSPSRISPPTPNEMLD